MTTFLPLLIKDLFQMSWFLPAFLYTVVPGHYRRSILGGLVQRIQLFEGAVYYLLACSVCVHLTLIAYAQSADHKYFLTLAEPLLQKNPKIKSPSLSQQWEGLRRAQQSVLHTDHSDAVVN